VPCAGVQGFRCADAATVADICSGLPKRLLDEFIEPLCVSALNLPAAQASGSIFLRVLHDACSRARAARTFCCRAAAWAICFRPGCAMAARPRACRAYGQPHSGAEPQGRQWLLRSSNQHCRRLEQSRFDAVLLACPPQEAARLALLAAEDQRLPARDGVHYQHWAQTAQALEHTAIATVYARTSHRLAPGCPGWHCTRRPGSGPVCV
jgi:hypothetical protein